ncbi:MFS transporter [Bacillus cereus]|uniref:MFS transporter n=1 Tax=Bacillus cereus TaxID=1396 RepID=UPI003012F44F
MYTFRTPIQNSWSVTLLLFWCGLIIGSSLYVPIPIISGFMHTFHITTQAATLATSINTFGYALGALIAGRLSDVYDRKSVINFGLVTMAVGSFFIGVTTTFFIFLILQGLLGIAAAMFVPSAIAYVVENAPKVQHVKIIGYISTGLLMSGIVGQIFSGSLYTFFAWQYIYMILGILYALTFLMVMRLRTHKQMKQSISVDLSFFQSVRSLFHNSDLVYSYGITFFLLFTFVGMYTILGAYLQHIFALEPTQILRIQAYGLLGTFIAPFTGQLVIRLGVRKTLLLGSFLSSTGLMGLVFCKSILSFGLISAVYVLGISIITPTLISLIGQKSGPFKATAVSLYTFILFVGASLGPYFSLFILKKTNYSSVFLILSCLMVLTICLATKITDDRTIA